MLTKVKLSGFKCFRDETLFPLSRINVLTGLNGRGKSTLIQSILSIAQSVSKEGISQVGWNGEFVRLGDYEDVRNRFMDDPTMVLYFESDDPVDKALMFSLGPDLKNVQGSSILSLQVDGVDRVTEMGLITADSQLLKDSEGQLLTVRELGSTSDIVSLRNFRNATYVAADRTGPVNRARYEASSSKPRLDIHGHNLLNVLQAMTDAQRLSVQSAMSSILRGGSMQVSRDKEDVVLRLDSSDSGQLFMPTNVGFGYGYILSTLIALELAENKSIFVIENPEAHLHPGAQAALTEHLLNITKEKFLQLIIETHSDHIINTCLVDVKKGVVDYGDISLLFFNKKKDDECGVQRLEITEQGQVIGAPEDFFDQIDKSLEILVGF